jgi:hypothetical protein
LKKDPNLMEVRGGELPYSNDDFGEEALVDELPGTLTDGYCSVDRGVVEIAGVVAEGEVGWFGGGDLASIARRLSMLSMAKYLSRSIFQASG